MYIEVRPPTSGFAQTRESGSHTGSYCCVSVQHKHFTGNEIFIPKDNLLHSWHQLKTITRHDHKPNRRVPKRITIVRQAYMCSLNLIIPARETHHGTWLLILKTTQGNLIQTRAHCFDYQFNCDSKDGAETFILVRLTTRSVFSNQYFCIAIKLKRKKNNAYIGKSTFKLLLQNENDQS